MRTKLIFLLLVFLSTQAQSQIEQIDSLKRVIESTKVDSVKVKTLISLSSYYYRSSPSEAIRYGELAENLAGKINFLSGQAYAYKSIGMGHYFQGNYTDALLSWQQSLAVFTSMGDEQGEANILNNLGAVYFNQGDDNSAIEYYLLSLKLAEKNEDKLRIATALVNIGGVYFNKPSTHDMALSYYLQSLPLSEELGDQDAIGTSTVNMGEIYLAREQADSALYYFERAMVAYQQSKSGNVAYAMNSIGKVYAFQGDFQKAISYQKQAYDIAESNDARLEMATVLLGIADTYKMSGDVNKAIKSFKEALVIAKEINISYHIKDCYEGLSECYAEKFDYSNAFKYQNLLIQIKDTLYNTEMDKSIQAATLSFDIEKKQGQIDLLTKDKVLQELDIRRQKTIRNATGITGILLLILAIGLFNRYKYIRKTNKVIEGEKALSEKLLLNILPEETAKELKEKGSATPKHYDMVSVLFTDFKGFTKIAEKLTPQELVEELNQCFLEFDMIIDKHNLEKIKTIGDAYMCAGGVPAANDTNPSDVVMAGLEIKQYMEDLKKKREANGEDYWELRIGIHTGSVIAGVVGKNKFAYDIWGDAVNTASRMESSGIPGKVNISGTTYDLIKNQFDCIHRGKIQAKNKGEIDMYIVEQVKVSEKLMVEDLDAKSIIVT